MKNPIMLPLVCWMVASAAECFGGADIHWCRIISPDTDRYCGWPSVCDAGDGDVLVAYSGDRSAHVCPWGKVKLIRSKDGGETWSRSETVCNSVLDDRDAGLLKLSGGELVLFWFTSAHYYEHPHYKKNNPDYIRHFEKLGMDAVKRDLGSFSRRSADGGRTWEAPVRLPASAPHGGVQLADGRLIVVGNQSSLVRGRLADDPAEKEFAGKKPFLVVAESADAGRNWREISRIPVLAGVAYEPHLIEGADGALRCYVRTQRNLVYTESNDGGATWSQLKGTSIPSWDSPPQLIRLKDGRTLLTYARRVIHAKDRKDWNGGVFARLGDGNGSLQSFESSNEIELHRLNIWDMGYPCTVECSDGALLTVFYGHADKVSRIQAVKWSLK